MLEWASSQPEPPRGQSHETILLVEDDQDVLAYTAEALESLGYAVIDASEASSALTALERRAGIRLLLTDVEPPGLNGQELAEEVIRRRPDIPVIYTTGYTANAIVHRDILERGARSLIKPFTLAQMATTVREMLDAKQLEHALRKERLR